MIHIVKEKKVSDEKILNLFRPYVKKWFKLKFKNLTLPQKLAIPLIKEGKNVLVTAPTGSGKTLAAFAAILDELFYLSENNKLEDYVYCIYVSPLRALDNDIYRNLQIPLKEISEIAKKLKYELKNEIRISVRTSDTKASEKAKQLIKPPHILITTPESLALMLVSKKFKEKLKNVKWLVIDEIHELANSKRGIHLSLSVERLEYFVGKRIQRIGLGATLEPIEEAAKFLVGCENGKERECYIVDARFVKKTDIKVLIPSKDLIKDSAESINKKMYKLIDTLVQQSRTTLIFTNTRSGAERVHYHLKQLFPSRYLDELTGVHHSSVSRDIRFEIEEKLKKGELKCVISSTSLELGIDIGYIDLVIQIGSPKSVSRLMQRIGRSGHALHEISRGRIICLDRDDLVECSIMVKKAKEYWLDKFHMPKNCLDVLAQHLLGMAIEKRWKIKEAYDLVRRAYPYKDLPYEEFLNVLYYLAGYYHTLQDLKVYGKIWLDMQKQEFGRRGKYARVIYLLNIGTIPEEIKIKVRGLDGKFYGFIEEAFLERLVPGDIFVIGGKTVEFVKAKENVAYVKEVKGAKPTIPSWFSEQLPLNFDLALEIGKFRGLMFELIKKEKKKKIIEFLIKELDVDESVAKNIYDYFKIEYEYLKKLNCKNFPSDKVILVESFIENDKQYIIFHTLYGRRVNDALSRAFAYALSKKISKSVGIAISDNGFALIVPIYSIFRKIIVDPKDVVNLVNSKNLEELLKKAIWNTELMKRKFRHCANRALMILRNYKGHEISLRKQQISAERILNFIKDIKDFPVLKETVREIIEDFMDIKNAKLILEKIEKGEIKYEILPISKLPSPFAHNLIAISESDVVLMEDRRKLLLELHKKIISEIKA